MKTEVKFSVRDLIGDMRDGAYDIQEGATVAGLIEASQKEVGKVLSEDVKKSFVFLVNSKPENLGPGALGHLLGKRRLFIDNSGRVGRKHREEFRLGGQVIFGGFMVIEVVACEIGKRSAIEIQPDHVEAHSSLGGALTRQGRLDSALATLRQA